MSNLAKSDIERLGRQRPPQFKTVWTEIGFVFSTCVSQVLSEYFVSGFAVIVPCLMKDLNIPISSSTWPATAYSLMVSSVMLPFGRLADIYGGRRVYIAGLAWLTLWSLIAGFSKDQYMLDICRALQGLGPAAFMPSGMMLLGRTYRPGPRKNLVFSIYGACGAAGFFIGIFFAGMTAEYAKWAWFFWVGAILSFISVASAMLCIPSENDKRDDLQMDWLGSGLLAASFILFVFAITDSAYAPQGFKTSYIIVTFVSGIVLFAIAMYVERYVASQPLLPYSLFAVPNMKPLFVALFFTYGSLGVFLLYATFYCTNILGASSLQLVAWFIPLAIGGCLIGTFGGFILHLVPGTALIIFSDITFNVTTIFITTSLPSSQQGLAGALINSIMQFAIAVCLGLSEIIANAVQNKSGSLRDSYRAVFWFEVTCASVALCILIPFCKIDSATAGLTDDERKDCETENKDANNPSGEIESVDQGIRGNHFETPSSSSDSLGQHAC
ncbi:Drug resistance protein YOR378W-like 5 [Botrytis cinerea]